MPFGWRKCTFVRPARRLKKKRKGFQANESFLDIRVEVKYLCCLGAIPRELLRGGRGPTKEWKTLFCLSQRAICTWATRTNSKPQHRSTKPVRWPCSPSAEQAVGLFWVLSPENLARGLPEETQKLETKFVGSAGYFHDGPTHVGFKSQKFEQFHLLFVDHNFLSSLECWAFPDIRCNDFSRGKNTHVHFRFFCSCHQRHSVLAEDLCVGFLQRFFLFPIILESPPPKIPSHLRPYILQSNM